MLWFSISIFIFLYPKCHFMFLINWKMKFKRVRLNYATTNHDPPPSSTTYHHLPPPTTIQNICTTTHHQPKYIHHYLPFPKKMDHHPTKAKIYSYTTSFRHCFNSFFFFPSVTDILSDEVLINSFFKFQITTTFSTFYDI